MKVFRAMTRFLLEKPLKKLLSSDSMWPQYCQCEHIRAPRDRITLLKDYGDKATYNNIFFHFFAVFYVSLLPQE